MPNKFRQIIGYIWTVINTIKLRYSPKPITLVKDSIVISPIAWKLFSKNDNDADNVVYADINDITNKSLRKVVAYFGAPNAKQLKQMTSLQWLQIPSHGANGYERKSLYVNSDIIVTRVKDVYCKPIAQYCVTAYYLFNTFAFRTSYINQSDCKLTPENPTVIIYGLGNIGLCIAATFKSMNWHVIGIKQSVIERNCESVDYICNFMESFSLLPHADYVVNILPESRNTIGIYNTRFFEMMKHDALFCNVGRKSAVIDKDLSDAVRNKVIRGAILDAHNDYNYKTPNIILTGHKSSISSENQKEFDKYFREQLNRFMKGEPVANPIALA